MTSLIDDPRPRSHVLAELRKSAEMYEKAAARAAADPAQRHNVDNLLGLARRRRDAIKALEPPPRPVPAIIMQHLLDWWQSAEAALTWWMAPHPLLDQRRPCDADDVEVMSLVYRVRSGASP